MKIERDGYGQEVGDMTEFDYLLLEILTEVASPDTNPDRSLAAYAADIKELLP